MAREASTGRPGVGRADVTRARIVRAGLALLDRDGYEAFSLRGVARELGVTPMALYTYFASKDALFDALLDAALGRPQRRPPSDDWLDDVRRLSLAFRRRLSRHLEIVPILKSRPALGANALRWYDAALATLKRSGIDDTDAARCYAALYSYILGFAAVERVRARVPVGTGQGVVAAVDEVEGLSVPTLRSVAPRTGRYTQRQFEFGLDLCLAGIAAFARR